MFILLFAIKEIMEGKQQLKRKHKKQQIPEYKNLNPFKQLEKRYKLYQHQETDFSTVYQPEEYQMIDGYAVAVLPYPKGSILVRNFNSPEIVFDIAAKALNVFWKKPYRTNLDSREEMYKQEGKEPLLESTTAKQTEIIGVEVQNDEKEEQKEKAYYFNDKIRWANVGYQYDWTERKYPNMKTDIPAVISKLCQRANKLYNTLRGQKKNYYPESAIINYYGEKDYMTGHLDDAEIDQISPIYSFSFGLSCIFLIGGKTKQTKPVAVRLNSGDLFIMSGESRQAYHGVPRILSKTFQYQQNAEINVEKEWKNGPAQIRNYLESHRLNINVRQVYPTED